MPTPIQRTIGGFNIEKQTQMGEPGGSLYYVKQTVDGYTDRQAVGIEARYFNSNLSGFSTYDYDLTFKQRNIFMVQGNYRMEDGTNFHVLGDLRKAPFLQLTNVLPAVPSPLPDLRPALTVTDALINSGVSLSDLRLMARAVTAESRLTNVGVTRPFGEKFQVGFDANWSSISGMDGAGFIPAQAGSGTTVSYNLSLVGSNWMVQNNFDVLNINQVAAPTYHGQNISFNHNAMFNDMKFRLDFGYRIYRQNDVSGGLLKRDSPTVRFSYRVLKNVSIEGEFGAEKSHQVDGTGVQVDSRRAYFYVGYRWDFQ